MILTPRSRAKGQIMYFLVNASPPKPLDAATSNFVHDKSHLVEGTGLYL